MYTQRGVKCNNAGVVQLGMHTAAVIVSAVCTLHTQRAMHTVATIANAECPMYTPLCDPRSLAPHVDADCR